MVDVQTISISIASAGVFIAAIYYIFQVRHQTKVRQTDTAIRLYSGASTKEAVEARHRLLGAEYNDYDEFVKKYGPPFSENPVQTSFDMVAMLMEGLGIMVKRKLVDISLVEELFPVPLMWGRIEPVAEGMRKHFNDPRFYEWSEYLYNEFMKYLQKKRQRFQQKGA